MENAEFLDILEESLTPEIYKTVIGYAAKRCKMLSMVGLPVERDLPNELAMEAILATAKINNEPVKGRRRWDPTKCKLSTHLCGIIRSRTHEMINRYLRYPQHSMDDEVASRGLELQDCRSEMSIMIVRELAIRIVHELYELAAADDHVTLLLMAYEDGVDKRRDIADEWGLTVQEYDNALKRLTRLIEKLPDELRRNAREYLRMGS